MKEETLRALADHGMSIYKEEQKQGFILCNALIEPIDYEIAEKINVNSCYVKYFVNKFSANNNISVYEVIDKIYDERKNIILVCRNTNVELKNHSID